MKGPPRIPPISPNEYVLDSEPPLFTQSIPHRERHSVSSYRICLSIRRGSIGSTGQKTSGLSCEGKTLVAGKPEMDELLEKNDHEKTT